MEKVKRIVVVRVVCRVENGSRLWWRWRVRSGRLVIADWRARWIRSVGFLEVKAANHEQVVIGEPHFASVQIADVFVFESVQIGRLFFFGADKVVGREDVVEQDVGIARFAGVLEKRHAVVFGSAAGRARFTVGLFWCRRDRLRNFWSRRGALLADGRRAGRGRRQVLGAPRPIESRGGTGNRARVDEEPRVGRPPRFRVALYHSGVQRLPRWNQATSA